MSDLIVGRAAFGPSTDASSRRQSLQLVSKLVPDESKQLLAELQRELGTRDTTTTFRKALALAKAARVALE